MLSISKAILAKDLLSYLRLVEEKGEELIVTENEVPVLRIVPLPHKIAAKEAFADVRGKVKYYADLNEPTTDEWTEV